MYLTRRQKEILDYLNEFIDREGYAPTIEEIAEHFSLRSLATVHKHLTNLQEKGLIRRAWNRSRALELVPTEVKVHAVELPLLGRVAAGSPIEAIDASETIFVPEDMIGRKRDLRPPGQGRLDDRRADPRRRLRHRGEPHDRRRRGDGDRAPRRRERHPQEAVPGGRAARSVSSRPTPG